MLFPYNHALLDDPAYRADVEELIELCAADGVAAADDQGRRPGPLGAATSPATSSAGTSRSRTRTPSPGPCATCCRDERLFLNTTSDARLLPLIVDGASGRPRPRPTDDELAADEATFGITPLFDGDDLERI